MTQNMIVTLMKKKLPEVQDPVFAVSMEDLLSAIANRMGEQALSLTSTEMLQARDEVRAAFNHYLDEREYIAIGLDNWEETQKARHQNTRKERT